jgi:outer membrane protein assembly factor BamB
VIAGERVLVGSDDGRLYAVGLERGDLIWEYSLGGPITAPVAVAEGRILVGCEDGVLYSLGPRR